MAAPAGSRKDDNDNRIYQWGDEAFFSVTTMLKAMPKHVLVPWAAKAVAEFTLDNLGRVVTEVLAGNREAICKEMKGAPNRIRDDAGDLGTAVHEAVEAYVVRDEFPQVSKDETIAQSIGHFQNFLRDFRPHYTHIEATVYNRKRKYAGTLDAIVKLELTQSLTDQLASYGWAHLINPDLESFMLDVKTGKGVYPEVGLQCSAYRYGEFIGLDGEEQPIPDTQPIALVLHLRPNGYKLIPARADEEVFKHFLYATQNFRWQNDVAKTILGKPLSPSLVGQLEASLELLAAAKEAGVSPQSLLELV
jgi:hypothetical protein